MRRENETWCHGFCMSVNTATARHCQPKDRVDTADIRRCNMHLKTFVRLVHRKEFGVLFVQSLCIGMTALILQTSEYLIS